ncbi:MAG: hypothetical protein Q4C42_04605 [Clostridia bacterium]|nr:hypothetical protein [Clostridia bacterium]
MRYSNKNSKLIVLIGIISALVALVATITTVLVVLDKKKDEEELERYLEESIQ